jgi:hypothetical protein
MTKLFIPIRKINTLINNMFNMHTRHACVYLTLPYSIRRERSKLSKRYDNTGNTLIALDNVF